MTYWTAILLGIVQGLAEFLPISSSGHLAILQNFLRIGNLESQMLIDVLLHLGRRAAGSPPAEAAAVSNRGNAAAYSGGVSERLS